MIIIKCTSLRDSDGELLDTHCYDDTFTFGELVRAIEGTGYFSDRHTTARTWAYSQEPDHRTGNETETSYHFAQANPPRLAKYWVKALEHVKRKRERR